MSLFGSDGCTAHHFEVASTSDDWRVHWDTPHFVLKRRATYKCAHIGCYESKEGWETVERYGINKDDDGNFRDEKMAELNEVLRFFKEEEEE